MILKPADIAFSRYIRQRDADEHLYCKCPLCDYCGPWQTFVCGHFQKRRFLITRWHEDNGHAICPDCNIKMETDQKLFDNYCIWVGNKIGMDRFVKLTALRQHRYKFTQVEIDEIAAKYRKLTGPMGKKL